MRLNHDVLTIIFSFIETYEEYIEYYTKFKSALLHTKFKNVIHIEHYANVNHGNLRVESHYYQHNVNYDTLDIGVLTFHAMHINVKDVKPVRKITLSGSTDYDHRCIEQKYLDMCKEIELRCSYLDNVNERNFHKITTATVYSSREETVQQLKRFPNLHTLTINFYGNHNVIELSPLKQLTSIHTLHILHDCSYESCFKDLETINDMSNIKLLTITANLTCCKHFKFTRKDLEFEYKCKKNNYN